MDLRGLKRIVDDNDTRSARVLDLVIQCLIVVSMISYAPETRPGLPESQRQVLRVLEIVTVAVFTCEYILRIVVADRKLGFIFSFFGLVDLLAILPSRYQRVNDIRCSGPNTLEGQHGGT